MDFIALVAATAFAAAEGRPTLRFGHHFVIRGFFTFDAISGFVTEISIWKF